MAGDKKQRGEIDVFFALTAPCLWWRPRLGTRVPRFSTRPRTCSHAACAACWASDQHTRSRAALAGRDTRFYVRSADGDRPLAVPMRGVRRVVHVTVTLDDVSAVAADLGRADEAGLLGDGLAWVVSLMHLETALELTAEVVRDEAHFAVPAVFVHYVLARLATDLAGVAAVQDEIDSARRVSHDELIIRRSFVDEIARHGLKRADVGRSYLPPTHRQIDAYVTARDADRLPPDRPQPAHKTPLLGLLRDLARWRPDEWLEVSLAMLELPSGPRDRLAAAYMALLRQHRDPRQQRGEGGEDRQGMRRGYGLHVIERVHDCSAAAHAAAARLAEKARDAEDAEHWFVPPVPRMGTIKNLGCALATRPDDRGPPRNVA